MTTLGEKLSDEEVEQVPHSQYPMRTVKISLFLMKHMKFVPSALCRPRGLAWQHQLRGVCEDGNERMRRWKYYESRQLMHQR